MADDTVNIDYWQPSKGSLTGFDSANIPTDNPNIAKTGWSLEQLKAFVLNQSAVNFPSADQILKIQAEILAHETDFDNPHKTTLDQIVGSFVEQVLGNIVPGTIPNYPPFYALDAQLSLPLGTLVPVTYSSSNVYRQSPGGWLINTGAEAQTIGTDYISGTPGIPMFSAITNIMTSDWATAANGRVNTTYTDATAVMSSYPFTFKTVQENPITGQFGVNLVMDQALDVTYTSTFFVYPSAVLGRLKIYQPSSPIDYIEVDLVTGATMVASADMAAVTTAYPDGVFRICVTFNSSQTVADNALRIIHLNTSQTGDGTRAGSFGRSLFSIAQPQTTKADLCQPVLVNLDTPGATSPMTLDVTASGVPATLNQVTIALTLNLYPKPLSADVLDPTILTFGPISITRDQTQIRVSIAGSPMFTSTILEGYNALTLSYSPTQLIFKDLAQERQVTTGTYPVLPTDAIAVGQFGGYLMSLALYAQADEDHMVEFLTDG